MRTIKTNVYKFSELSEYAKERAIDNLRFNIYDEWWDGVYEDAENVGLRIAGFGLDRNRHAMGEFIEGAEHCAARIITGHGKDCETYKTAAQYLKQRGGLVTMYSDGVNTSVVAEDNEYDFDNACDDLDEEFLKSILEDYSILLQNESEYLQSDEAIIEAIKANEYEFTEDGELI